MINLGGKEEKMKNKNSVKIILIFSGCLFLVILAYILCTLDLNPNKEITGIENYDKNHYIEEYGGDLDSNLSIFPNDKSKLINADFSSSFKTGLFDSDGYILLRTKYSEEDFNNEVERLSKIEMTIKENCYPNSKSYTNYIKYDENNYKYPAYITIDGFGHTYEYALINKDDLEIIYVYLAYPSVNNSKYSDYLKEDKSEYSKTEVLSLYSMYNHTFNNGSSFVEFNDCGR